MEVKVKMKRHESFSIREGWLVKGINSIKNNNKIFSSSDATDVLGLGTNMVKSLKYWMFATGLLKEENRNVSFTTLALLLDEYDPFLENSFSWWLIHLFLVTNSDDAYIFNLFFNKYNAKTFTKKDVYEQISYELDSLNINYNEGTLQDELNIIIKTYAIDEKIDNPENNFVCPLSELKLLKKVNRDVYEKLKPDYKKLNYLIVYYSIQNIVSDNSSISIDDILKNDNSPAKVFNLDKNLINEYLDEMKRNNLITINRTAGLNMVYINNKIDLEDIFRSYYE